MNGNVKLLLSCRLEFLKRFLPVIIISKAGSFDINFFVGIIDRLEIKTIVSVGLVEDFVVCLAGQCLALEPR